MALNRFSILAWPSYSDSSPLGPSPVFGSPSSPSQAYPPDGSSRGMLVMRTNISSDRANLAKAAASSANETATEKNLSVAGASPLL
ncbi:MAG: hypothetical protein LBS92_00995 [Candidatus Methanoplasma sp.]|nr:hypothetical protein [Candidatus Methanoplasma sp.]